MDKNISIEKQTIRDVQMKILDIMKFIDKVCRKHNITYFIMGGTALGAVRHGGFIPWDDDLDIFMTPDQYEYFKKCFNKIHSDQFILQEWKTVPEYLEYAKIRMNGTTFIEENLKDFKNMHHGIYVDIMILHKVPLNRLIQKILYYKSKFVTLFGLSQRNWKPKTNFQALILKSLRLLPCKWMARQCYRHIYKYDEMQKNYMYCYWITPAKFRSGLFPKDFFDEVIDIPFEDTMLLASKNIKEYLEYRYGNYMKLPSKEAQKNAIHAYIYSVNKDYKEFI